MENVLPRINRFVFGFAQVMQKTSALKCFEIAAKHRLYFFVFEPLVKMRPEEYVSKIYHPLVEERGGKLTKADRLALQRLADEFQFSWADFNIDIDN